MRRGVGLVELLVAMLVTMIIGGAATTLLRSGMDIDVRTVSGVLTQRSMGLPYLELLSVVEHAEALEILPTPPERSSLGSDNKVLFLSAPGDDDLGRSFLTLRTRDGDRRLPGFYNLSGIHFEKRTDAGREFVRLTLSADHNDREAVQTSDLYSLNIRTAIGGNENGPVLRIGGGAPVYALDWVAVKDEDSKIITSPTITVGKSVIGDYLLSDGAGSEISASILYEWRLYPPGSATPDILRTGTMDAPPAAELQISHFFKDHYLEFAARSIPGEWVSSNRYLIVDTHVAKEPYFSTLIKRIRRDFENNSNLTITDGYSGDIAIRVDDDGEAYLELRSTGRASSTAFFTDELTEEYFGELDSDGKRNQAFCIENFSVWIDANVTGDTNGWGALLNGNVNAPDDPEAKRIRNYGYMFQFDPGLGGDDAFVVRNMTGVNHSGSIFGVSPHYQWGDIRSNLVGDGLYSPSATNKRREMRDRRYTTRITVLTKTKHGSVDGTREAEKVFFRVDVYDKPPVADLETGKLTPPSDAKKSKTIWYGVDGDGVFHCPLEKVPTKYALSQMENVRVDPSRDNVFRIGRFFGMRSWTTVSGQPFDLKLYNILISEGFEDLDELLPWGATVGDAMGEWDPKNPFINK